MTPEAKAIHDIINQGWTKGALARDGNGISINPHSNEAVSWCIVGAECKAEKENPELDFMAFYERMHDQLTHTQFFRSRVDFNNDESTTLEDMNKILESC